MIDVAGATLLGLVVLGLALLFASTSGLRGGRYTLAVIVGTAGFLIWGLWYVAGPADRAVSSCPSCGAQEPGSREP